MNLDNVPSLLPQTRGGALLAGGKPGERRKRAPEALIREARHDLGKILPQMAKVALDEKRAVEDRVRAAEFVRKVARLETVKGAQKRGTISVVRATPAEQAQLVADAASRDAAQSDSTGHRPR